MNARTETVPVLSLPGATDRTAILGGTGTGKTVFGGFLLSKQRFDERPWVCLDFKDEELWDLVGDPPMRDLKLGQLPGKTGLYRLRVTPGQEDDLENWLWQVWAKENIGLFCDEVTLIPKRNAFKAILRQGRSKRIPVIACSQRPVDVEREVWSEASIIVVFQLDDERDVEVVKYFTRKAPIDAELKPHHSFWYDKKKRTLERLKPCPGPDNIAKSLKAVAPYSWWR